MYQLSLWPQSPPTQTRPLAYSSDYLKYLKKQTQIIWFSMFSFSVKCSKNVLVFLAMLLASSWAFCSSRDYENQEDVCLSLSHTNLFPFQHQIVVLYYLPCAHGVSKAVFLYVLGRNLLMAEVVVFPERTRYGCFGIFTIFWICDLFWDLTNLIRLD